MFTLVMFVGFAVIIYFGPFALILLVSLKLDFIIEKDLELVGFSIVLYLISQDFDPCVFKYMLQVKFDFRRDFFNHVDS